MKPAILLVNLGSPEAATSAAVRRYLAEFLADRRVVDLPRWLWLPVLHGIILRTRPARSAEKYATIWMPEGSPLRVHTERQAKLLKGLLGSQGKSGLLIDWAMRYGQPLIGSVLDRLVAAGVTHVLVVPLYPQYAGSTTASVEDAVAAWQAGHRDAPEIALLPDYHRDTGYIEALAASVREHWRREGRRGERLVMSFHGIPQRAVDQGDPYAGQCRVTARLLAEALGLGDDDWQATFQSRFGRARWLQPYTQPTLEAMAAAGVRRVDVICPGFAADCLETLEEIDMECRVAFLAHGGETFSYIPCLNERPDWIAALADLVQRHLPPR